jgi:hypothetical protein
MVSESPVFVPGSFWGHCEPHFLFLQAAHPLWRVQRRGLGGRGWSLELIKCFSEFCLLLHRVGQGVSTQRTQLGTISVHTSSWKPCF